MAIKRLASPKTAKNILTIWFIFALHIIKSVIFPMIVITSAVTHHTFISFVVFSTLLYFGGILCIYNDDRPVTGREWDQLGNRLTVSTYDM